jgi:hypothetical protein
MSVLGSETVGTERDLNAERRHLEAVLDALPFLDGSDGISEWLIEDPEEALGDGRNAADAWRRLPPSNGPRARACACSPSTRGSSA